jgi:hypothetical protein
MELSPVLKEIASKDVMVAAGYQIGWHRRKTKADGCPCQLCQRRFPAGTRMWVLDGRWAGTRAVVCLNCAGAGEGV